MKVEIEANELRSGKIEKLSLVDHGANQQPFQILKMREIGAARTGVKDTIAKIFGASDDSDSKVVAMFIRKDVAQEWVPLAKKYGFTATKESAELTDGVLVLKQEGFDPEVEGTIIALNENVAVQLDSVKKYFDTYPMSADFNENVAAASFFPGLHNALESLAETVWNVLNGSDAPDDAAPEIAKQVKAFGVYVNNLVTELPQVVFKMEHESLTKEFEPSTVQTTDTKITVTKGEEQTMNTAVLKEAAAGDLDGLLDDVAKDDAALEKIDAAAEEAVEKDEEAASDDDVKKGGDEGAPKSGGSPGSPVVENTADSASAVVQLDEGGVPAGFRKEERVVKQLEDGKLVEKTQLWFINDESKEEIFGGFVEKATEEGEEASEDAAPESEYTPAELKLFADMGVLAKSVVELKELVEKQNEKLVAVEKTADTAKETAEETVVMSVADDLDNSLATLRGEQAVLKAADAANAEEVNLWKGALPMLETDAA